MKLKHKLFLYFGILFFVTMNIYGVILIESNFNTVLQNTINGALGEYSVIYANIKSNSNTKNMFFDDKDILKIKSDFYLKNNNNPNVSLQFRDMSKDIIYFTGEDKCLWPESIYDLKDNLSNYLIYKMGKDKSLIINNYLNLNDNKYYFIYMYNLDSLYNDKYDSYLTLIKLNVVIGILLLVVIYLISDEITKPIYSLINIMDEIINGNYNKRFKYTSNIYEMNEISNNFSLMNDEIQNKISELEESNNEKERFINNLTHEIRTPLTSIIGYSDLMIKKKVKDMNLIYKSFENINREGNRILRLASNLITLIMLDKKSLNLSWFSIAEVIEEVKNRMKIKSEGFNINIIIEGEDYRVFSDRELVFILISNLIDNSIKAVLNSETKNIKIIIDNSRVIIKDTGKGIPQDELNRIFEPFYMIDKSRSKSIEGFGLGLSICREIISLLNIKFDISSEVNKGTEIDLKFREISEE